MVVEESADSPQKRRKVDSKTSGGNVANKGNSADISDEWRIEVNCGTDETLQIKRVETAHGSTLEFNSNLLDSYTLETLITGTRISSRPFEDINSDIDKSDYNSPGWCVASVAGQFIAVTKDKAIHILSADSACIEAVIRHDYLVTSTALSKDALFVAFGDSEGTLFIVHVGSRRVVFSRPMGTELGALRFSEIDSRSDECREELVLVAGSQLVRFAGIRLRALGRAISSNDMTIAGQIRSEIAVESVALADKRGNSLHSDGVSSVAVVPARESTQAIVAGSGAASLSSWLCTANGDSDDYVSKMGLSDAVSAECAGSEYTHVQVSANGRYALALSRSGMLDVYERLTLTRVFRYSEAPVADFGIVTSRAAHLRIAAIVSEADDEDSAQLIIVDLPSGNVIYSMDVAKGTWLARGFNESVVFVETQPSTFFVRKLSEALPLDRLAHFLRGRRYAEAESFARAHGIPETEVCRQRVISLVDSRCEVDPVEAIDLLASLDDEGFVTESCLRLHTKTLPETQQLLRYARSVANAKSNIASVDETLLRLGTWQAVGSHPFNAGEWHSFRSADLASCARAFLSCGDVLRASLLWRRHAHDAKLRGDLAGALQAFPSRGDVVSLAQWLRSEALPNLKTAQQRFDVDSWLEQRARALEAIPGRLTDALLLAGLAAEKLVKHEADQAGNVLLLSTPQQFIAAREKNRDMRMGPTSGAAFLHTQLLDLVLLQQKHALSLTLDSYAQLSFSDISRVFLDRVAAPELLSDAFRTHFLPYTQSHRLDHAEIAQQYCIDCMNTRKHWEPRVLQLMRCLSSECTGTDTTVPMPLTTARMSALRAYADVALEAMRRSVVPWSAPMDSAMTSAQKLLKLYADSDPDIARLSLDAAEHIRLMKLKRMLMSYGLGDFHISNTRMALPLLQCLVRRTDEDVMSDMLQLVDAYHHLSRPAAYVLRIQALCEMGQPEATADLVRFVDSAEHSAPDANAADAQQIDRYVPMEVVRRALCWIREVLDSMSFSTDASREQFRLHVSAAMSMTGALESLARRYSGSSVSAGSFGSNTVDKHSGRMSLIELERLQSFVSSESSVMTVVWQLLIDGGVMVSPGELDQASTRAQILSDFIDQQWLCTLVGPSAIGSKDGDRSRYGHNAKGKGKGKGNSNAEDLMSTSTCAVETIPLPPIPARIRTLATMLRFTSAELGQRIVLRCLELRLYMMALDMCHQLVETLNPLTSSSLVQDARLQGEWPAALRALAACERSIGSLLISLNAGGLRGEVQGALVRRLSVLCQVAARKCASHTYLTYIIDAYACWDFAQCVFDQTTDGDFALLTKRPSARQTGARTHSGAVASKQGSVDSGAGSSSSSARNSAGSSTAASINDMFFDTGKEYFDESTTDSHEGALSSWLNPLFANIYVERGLVLDTKQTMYMVYRLTMALRRLSSARSLEFADDSQRNKQRSSGKAAEPMSVGDSLDGHNDDDDHGQSDLSHEALRSSAVYRCGELVAHLVQNRHWVLAVQALELAASQLSTSAFATEHSQQCDDESSITQIRQRLSSGGIGQDEVSLLLGNSSDSSAATDIQALISKSLVRSLQQQRGLDTVFIFSAMLMSPPMRAYQYLSTAMSHAGLLPARVIDLANIGAACSLFWQQQALLDRCRSVAAAARWGEQLQLLELKFDIAQLNDPKSELLFPLVRPMLVKTGMDISTILEFAEAFKLDETSVILEYISLCCSAPHVEGYQARVLGVADEIANTKLLERTFVDCLENAISSYDYERLHFVVQRLQDLRPQDAEISKYSAVLDVLSSYDRQSSPTFDELVFEWTRTRAACSRMTSDGDKKASRESNDKAMDTDPTLSELLAEHPMALKRLPFHLLVNSAPWSTLLPELSSDTIDSLLPLAPALDLNEDDFYMNLIDSMLKKWKANDVTVAQPAGSGNSSGSSGVDAKAAFELAMSKTPTHFNSVQQLIRCFKDPEAAISTIKHVADEFPCGPDRIAALKMGIKLLYKWGQFIKRMAEPERSQMMTKAEAIYAHFEKSHTDATAEIELRCNGLEKHLPLFIEARGTESTIRALAAVFEDECDKYDTASLLKAEDTEQAEEGTSSAPRESKLHETMRNLAKIYDISLESLMQKLLEGYLETSVHLARTASDLQLPSAGYQISLRQADSQEATLRRRIICILRAYPASDSVRSLLGFAYAPKGGISCLCRARALEILFSLASDEDIAQLQQPEDVHKYFQALLYMADFEYVGIPQSTADFLDCQKAALARSIWVDYHQDPRAVQLICNMCLDFGVDDCDLILQILPRLLVAGLYQYTVGVLDTISSMSCYSANIKELPELWSRAISGLFVQMASTHRHEDGSGGERQDWVETVLAALGSCLRSAFLPDIDTTRIVQALFKEYSVACTDFCSAKAAAAAAQQLACVAFDVLPYSQTAEGVLLGHLDALPASDIHCLIMRLLDFAECALNLSSPSVFVDWTASRSLSLIFDIVDSMRTHEQVLLNPPLGRAVHAFVHNRIRHDKLQMAVQACLNKGKQQLAMQLVSRYYQTRPTDMLVEDAKSAGIKTDFMDMTLDATSDYTSSAFSADTPTGTQEVSRAARRFVKGLSEQNLLDIYLKSRTTAT
ncbi:hypothetical protein FB645_000816 [Coemansia sp. IMI 203386]|nr:hypothetical protein FB645_000816 [Coemansia sp. IMI 203386]